jgi:hypothetical protein
MLPDVIATHPLSTFIMNRLKSVSIKFAPTLHSTLEIQLATLFGEKCVRLYLLDYTGLH